MPQTTRQEVGRAFEARVQAALLAGGFRIEGRRQIAGFQFDIIAFRDEEFGVRKKLAVECKFKAEGEVGTQEVAKFVTAFNLLKAEGFAWGVVVSNVDFSRGAWGAITQAPSVLLKSIHEFEDEFLGLRRAFRIALQKYTQEQAAPNYISLSARAGGQLEDSFKPEAKSLNLEEALLSRTNSSYRSLSIIFGDFGSGKTTTLRRVNSLLQSAYVNGERNSVPFLFILREYKEADIADFVEKQLQQHLGLSWSFTTFSSVIANVHSVLLLDGFDEIAITATAKKRQFYFVELSKLLGNSTHSIIATRPSYFSSIEELKTLIEHSISGQMQEIPDLVDSTQYLSQYLQSELEKRSYGSKWVLASIPTINTFVVQGLSREMILAYLGHYRESLMKSYGMDEKAIFKQLEEIYDISDLIQRPLLLDIIVFVLGTGRFPIKKADQVSATMLYNIYVQEQVKYEIGKGSTRVFLTPGERIMFARAMALAMLEGDGSLAVSYPALIDLIARNRDIFEGERQRILDHSLESVATDVCVCGFLTLRHDSKFEFVHKSFFEFFVAYAVRDEIVKRKGAYLQAKTLPWEILYFLGGFLQEDSALRDQVANELDQRRLSNRKRRTLLGAKLYSELTTSDATFDDFSFDDFDLKKKIFSKCIMRKMRLAGGGIGDIAFDRCDMKEVCLIDSKINSIEIIDCEGGIGIERGAVNKVVCQTPRGNEFNIKVLCECRTLILAGVRGQILGRALGGETKIEHSRIIVDEFATDKDSEEFGRVSHSELLFGNPKFSGSRDEEFRELITAVGAKYRRLLANCSHADLINVVMTFTQFERVTKELSARRGNRLIVRVFEFDGESKEFGTNVYPLGKEEIVADVTGRCVGILVNRMERTRVEKLDKLIRSCENDPDRSFDELTKKLAAL